MVPLTWTVSVVPFELRSTVTLMPQVPTRVPLCVTVMPPWIVSCSENVLATVSTEPLAPMFSPPSPTYPVVLVQLLRCSASPPLKLHEVPAALQLASMLPFTVTLPLASQSTVALTGSVSAFLSCGPGWRCTPAPNAPDTMTITSAESCVEKLPLVGSTQLEPPPHATKTAAAATAILLCIRNPPALRVLLQTDGRQGTAGGASSVDLRLSMPTAALT